MNHMETLSSIAAQEQSRRQRAMQFEAAQNEAVKQRANVARLTTEVAGFDTTALRQMAELVAKVPAGAKTASRSSLGVSIPSGIGGRQILGQVVDAVLSDTLRREADLQGQLKTAQAKLKKVEAALEGFE
jgi:hypothetical protein